VVAQCVVAGRSSSRPAAASANAPVQIDTIRVPGRIRPKASASSGVSRPFSYTGPYSCDAGTTTVSASSTASGPCAT
jgi:hypothetical protein